MKGFLSFFCNVRKEKEKKRGRGRGGVFIYVGLERSWRVQFLAFGDGKGPGTGDSSTPNREVGFTRERERRFKLSYN